MKSRNLIFGGLMIFCFFMAYTSGVYGESIPQLINYNGTLTDASGNPVPDGNYDVTFTIYDAPTGSNVLWTEVWNATTTKVIVADGTFNAMLGAHTPIPTSFFADHPVAYLGVKVENDSEMLPRQRITSVGYAFTAGNGVPKRAIIMWSGTIEEIPEGWALDEEGRPTTDPVAADKGVMLPDLRAKFVIGSGNGYEVGSSGGSKTLNLSHIHTTGDHTLTVAQIPPHNHANGNYKYMLQYTGGNTTADTDSTSNEPDIKNKGEVTNVGGGQPHNHGNTGTALSANQDILPPFFALAFIMKL